MHNINIQYLTNGRKTFDLKTNEIYRKESQIFLEEQCSNVYAPDNILTSVENMNDFLNRIPKDKIDIIIYQSITFADAEFIHKVVNSFSQPVIVWSVREPVVGQRLMLNSLTGGNSTCHALRSYKRFYHFVFGNPNEKNVLKQLESYFRTEEQVKKISQLTIGVIGEHPPGFYFCSTNESKLKSKTGVNIHKIDLLDSLNKCLHISEKESLPIISEIENQIVGVDIGADEVKKFAKFATYIKSYIEKNNVNALAIRNWPEFFTEFGAAAGDTSISYFTENGIPSANESDIHGALSMYILQEIGEGPPFLGDLVHLNDENNSVTFWHDGAGAFSLANPKTGAVAGVHPNRKLGLSMDFGLKSGEVTIARFSEINNEGD